MRLIDADELFKEIATLSVDGSNPMGQGYCAAISDVSNLITNQPTFEPVKRGKWECDEDDFVPTCSECGKVPLADGFCLCLSPYCPHCGAQMDGEDNG